jgi:hypothetical protein
MPRTTYSAALAAELCARIAEGRSLRDICGDSSRAGDPDMPARRTVYHWLARRPEFERLYATAVALRSHDQIEEILQVARDETLNPTDKRARIDALKWVAGKMNAPKYGERASEGGGRESAGGAVVVFQLPDNGRSD